jgi:hypothetical protein
MINVRAATKTFRLQLPDLATPFTRADLAILGLDHSGPSVEVRVFFNVKDATEDSPTDLSTGFAGLFSIFGHGGCFGDEGHCEMPERRTSDLRPQYALTPINKHVDVTPSVRRLIDEKSTEVDVTLVPILHDVPAYVPEDLLIEPVKFERLSIVLYQ